MIFAQSLAPHERWLRAVEKKILEAQEHIELLSRAAAVYAVGQERCDHNECPRGVVPFGMLQVRSRRIPVRGTVACRESFTDKACGLVC